MDLDLFAGFEMPISPRVYLLGKFGWVLSLIMEKSWEYWVIRYFKCSDAQNCANLWILRQARLLDNKKKHFVTLNMCTLSDYFTARSYLLAYAYEL